MRMKMEWQFRKAFPIYTWFVILAQLFSTACSSSNSDSSGNDPDPLIESDSFVLELLADKAMNSIFEGYEIMALCEKGYFLSRYAGMG